MVFAPCVCESPLNCTTHSSNTFVGICQMEKNISGVKTEAEQFGKAPGVVPSSAGATMWLAGDCQLEVMNDLECFNVLFPVVCCFVAVC